MEEHTELVVRCATSERARAGARDTVDIDVDERDALVLRVALPSALAKRVGRLAELTGLDEASVVLHVLSVSLPSVELAVGATRQIRSCPRCRAAPQHTQLDEIALSGCRACGGIWLDNAAALKLTQTPSAQVAALARDIGEKTSSRVALEEVLACPVCEVPMQRVDQPHVGAIDTCAAHGTFFDAGELERMIAVLGQRLANAAAMSGAHLDHDLDALGDLAQSTYEQGVRRGRRID